MNAPAPVPAAQPAGWSTSPARPMPGAAVRAVAGVVTAAIGGLLAVATLGGAVAFVLIDRGLPGVSAADAAAFRALAPVMVLIGGAGIAHVVIGGLLALGARTAAGAAVVLGLLDAAAGATVVAVAVNGSRGQADGVGIGMTTIAIGGIVAALGVLASVRSR